MVTELVQPWLAPDPAPLMDTQPPETLGDPDSRFILVDGVLLHVKQRGVRGAPAVLLLHGFNGRSVLLKLQLFKAHLQSRSVSPLLPAAMLASSLA